MYLLFLLNGRADKILSANSLSNEDFEVIKIDEKELMQYRSITSAVRSKKYDSVFFGCIENDLQRFHFFMLLYILITTRSGAIIDESGNMIKFSFLNFLFMRIPLFALEVIFSAVIVIYHYIKLPIEKWKWLKTR
jgi:hypothetical protein